jgi:HTH-type transcriptional regulator / antitoxin HigA
MESKLTPARLVPPGRILRRELDARGWDQKDLAVILGRPEKAISAIVTGKKQITPDTAIKLGEAFGTSADLWINLESSYRLRLAQREKSMDEVQRRSRLFELLPFREIVRRGWIDKDASIDVQEQEVCQLLGISTLKQKPNLAVSFRGSKSKKRDELSCFAWMKQVEKIVRGQSVKKFDRDLFVQEAVPKLLKLAVSVDDVQKIMPLLAKYGVHFTILKHLPKTYLDGAAFNLKNNPVVALTLRYDRIDYFWFTLMHELAHIAYGHNGILDFDGESTAQEERLANRKAQGWLIPQHSLEQFMQKNAYSLPVTKIKKFADSINVHPGIVLGRLQYEKLAGYGSTRSLKEKVSPYLEGVINN